MYLCNYTQKLKAWSIIIFLCNLCSKLNNQIKKQLNN